MSGTDPNQRGSKRIDRTHAYRPDDAAEPPPPAENLPKIPGITLQFEIARGGMGVVYSGRQDFLDRRVAVKLLSVELGGESFVQRFQREAKILAGIKHPNIVACHMAGQTDDGQSYLVMEFIDGPSLKKWIADNGVVPARSAVRTARAVAQALAHAHTLGIIHRDVKPENILLETVTSTAIDIAFPFTPKLVDLGLARASSGNASLGLTSPGSVMGTPATMSPEQYDEPDGVDFRSDIYGLGCAIYEMLVGQPAYRGKRLSDILAKKHEPVAPDACKENASVPAAIGALVQSMLATNRDDRPRSYKELDEQFAALLDAMTSSRATKVPFDDDGGRTVVRRPGQRDEPAPAADKTIAKAKTQPPSPAPPGPPAPPAKSGGGGILGTQEINFLAEGLGETPADPAAASPFKTRPPADGAAPAPAPTGDVWATKPPSPTSPTLSTAPGVTAPMTSPPAAAAKGKTGLIAAAGVVVLGLVAWLVFKPSPEKERDARSPDDPKPPARTIAAEVKGDEVKDLDETFRLDVEVKGSDKGLTYEWTVPDDVVSLKGATNRKELRLALTDGLPGVPVEIKVDVRDGASTKTLTHVVKVGKCKETKPLLGFKENPEWVVDRPADHTAWKWVYDDSMVSCSAKTQLRTLSTSLGSEAYWEWFGSIESLNDEKTPYAKVGMRFEFGDDAWLVTCHRTGTNGEKWTAEIKAATRRADQWDVRNLEVAPVAWTEPADTEDDYRARFSVQRQRNKLILLVGETHKPPAQSAKEIDGASTRFEVELPAGATSPRLTLFVDQGIGRFRVTKR